MPSPPTWLAHEAKAEWARVVPELYRLGLLTLVDRAALGVYCQTWARYVAAERVLADHGMSIEGETKGGHHYLQQRPEVAISKDCAGLIKAFCHEFGLTPSSRSRMQVPEAPEVDPVEALLD
jgi:P27 family predicted phage terminase small subunit